MQRTGGADADDLLLIVAVIEKEGLEGDLVKVEGDGVGTVDGGGRGKGAAVVAVALVRANDLDIQDERVVFDDDVEVLLDAVLVELFDGERRLSQDGEARG